MADKVEKESSDEEIEHDHENCKDHDHDHGHDHEGEGHDPEGKSHRGEKKFKKAMLKMGLKAIQGINRVTIKKGKAFIISIDDPDVWKTPGNESGYVIFGKPDMGGLSSGQEEARQFKNPESVKVEEVKQAQTDAPASEEPKAETEEVSAVGLKPENITMVMEYTKCTKAEAIKALRETDDDSVNAIMRISK